MGLEVLFDYLLPELHWDSSDHLLPSADQQAQLDVSAHLCPGVVQLPLEAAESCCAQQLPPLGGCSLGEGLWHLNLPLKGQTRGWFVAKHPGA